MYSQLWNFPSRLFCPRWWSIVFALSASEILRSGTRSASDRTRNTRTRRHRLTYSAMVIGLHVESRLIIICVSFQNFSYKNSTMLLPSLRFLAPTLATWDIRRSKRWTLRELSRRKRWETSLSPWLLLPCRRIATWKCITCIWCRKSKLREYIYSRLWKINLLTLLTENNIYLYL